MQELEKILEEIEAEFDRHINTQLKIIAGLNDDVYRYGYGKSLESYQQGKLRVTEIIRKHMNDGWIPVEDRLPENTDEMEVTLSNEDVTSAWYNRASRKWLVETRDKDGEDVKVIAWKSHSDPYRPGRKGARKKIETEV